MCDLEDSISSVSVRKTAGGAQPARIAQAGPKGPITFRWLGGGVAELASPDDSQIMLVDAWIWNNAGYARFGLQKPAELASAAAYADHLVARKPQGVLVMLTHDHGDHIGDYFELLKTLSDRELNVKTVGQSDMMRFALVPKFKEAGLDPAAIVVNAGAGINFGGTAAHAGMRATLVPAIHSCLCGMPPAGFIAQINNMVVYASGDTDLYGDMALTGRRYKPDLAIVCVGGSPFTMGPADAAEAVRMLGAHNAIPVHYAHNPAVLGPEAGETFRAEVARIAPAIKVTVLKPGASTTIT